jgi:hypothetical protein
LETTLETIDEAIKVGGDADRYGNTNRANDIIENKETGVYS